MPKLFKLKDKYWAYVRDINVYVICQKIISLQCRNQKIIKPAQSNLGLIIFNNAIILRTGKTLKLKILYSPATKTKLKSLEVFLEDQWFID